jgi:peptidyl-prolyl cis-trans isomerase D
MPGIFDNQKVGVRILFGVVIGLIAVSMLLYLVPQGVGTSDAAPDVLAKVGDQSVTMTDVRTQLQQISQRNQIPPQLEGLYAKQILNSLVFQKEVEYESKRLGITASDKELADRVRQYVPGAFNDGSFVGNDTYATEVQQRFQMTVPAFETLVRQGLIEEKLRKLVTDGISVGPAEIQEQFLYQNEKVKLDYVLIKPEDMAAKVTPDEVEIKAYYDANRASLQIPEKRVVRYALIDLQRLRATTPVTDDELKAAYQQNIAQYEVPNRVHAEHILLTTVGKTDAEVAEVKAKAVDILAQAKKKGANFEDLAKKYSEDPGSKTKGGDLGWLVQGQTVPEFEKAAFSLNKGEMSDLIKTQYGFHIIKVLDKESAHTKSFDEVKDSIRTPYMLQKADQEAGAMAEKLSSEIRQSNKTTLDQIAAKYQLPVADTRPVAAKEPVFELGNSPEVKDEIFRLRQGELSLPIRTDRGYVVMTLKEIVPTHPGTLDEVRDKVIAAIKQQKGTELVTTKAADLQKRVSAGEKFDAAAKALGLDPKTSDSFTRIGSITGVGSGKQLGAAFSVKQGALGAPIEIGPNSLVYLVAEKTEPDPADFEKQKKAITDSLLQEKRTLAFDAFRLSLEERLKQEGKVKIMNDKMSALGGNSPPIE